MLERPVFCFEKAQTAFDLIWVLQSLNDEQLFKVGGDDFPKIVRTQSCRFESEADAPCFEILKSKTLEPNDGAEIAVAIIVANDLQKGLWHGEAITLAEYSMGPFRAASRRLRTAISRGLDALEDRPPGHEHMDYYPKESRLTRPVAQVLPKLYDIARNMDLPTRKSVAAADYGYAATEYLAALEAVLASENCQFPEDKPWMPSEVVSLVSHVRDTIGFVPCTALLLANALQGRDDMGSFAFRWGNLAVDYNRLPDGVRAPILAGLRCLYEDGSIFNTYTGHDRCDPVTQKEGMIGFVEFCDDID